MNSTLARSDSDRMIGGVCGGLAGYFGIDSAIVRLIFVLAVLSGVSPLVYLVLWIILPEAKSQPSANQPVIAEHPRPAEQWKYDPYTGEKIER
jgi:phage shock protein C